MAFVYSVADFLPFTKIISADVNARFNDLKTLINVTGFTGANIQDHSIDRSTKLSTGTAGFVLINDGSGNVSEEATLAIARGGLGQAFSLTNNAGKAIVVNPGETGFALGTPTVDRLTEQFAADISSLTAGEAISAGDAVCLDLSRDASNLQIYRVYQTDSDLPNRRANFMGFATAAATVVAGTYTWTDSAALVASNVITWSINGRFYTQSFTTDNNTTLTAIASQISGDPEIQSAAVVGAGANDRVINITSKGGLFINIVSPLVTGGASQATIVIANTQAPSGQSVQIRCFGPFTTTGLTVGLDYYLSGTAGAITVTPSDTNPIFVGQALSSTVLFVNRNVGSFQFSTPVIMIKSHGGSTGVTAANFQLTAERFNFTSWTTETADSAARGQLQGGNAAFLSNNTHLVIDGVNTAGSVAALTSVYNKSSWSAGATRGTALRAGGIGGMGSNFYAAKGSTNGAESGAVATLSAWNGTAWSGPGSFSNAAVYTAVMIQGSKVRSLGGSDTGSTARTYHDTYDGGSFSTDTAYPESNSTLNGQPTTGGNGIILSGANASPGYSFSYNGTSFSSSAGVGYRYSVNTFDNTGPSGSYNGGSLFNYINGGSSASTTSVTTTAKYNGSTWSSDTASSTARAQAHGSVF